MFQLEIKGVVALNSQVGYALYPMFKDAICCWSYPVHSFFFLLKGKFSP